MTDIPESAIAAAADAIMSAQNSNDGEPERWEARNLARAALEAAAPSMAEARDRELLEQAAEALWNCAKSALTVKPTLDQPYPDYPEWTPYARWVEQPARRAHDLAMAIRKHLKDRPDGGKGESDAEPR